MFNIHMIADKYNTSKELKTKMHGLIWVDDKCSWCYPNYNSSSFPTQTDQLRSWFSQEAFIIQIFCLYSNHFTEVFRISVYVFEALLHALVTSLSPSIRWS